MTDKIHVPGGFLLYHQSDVDALLLQHRERLGSGLAFDGDLDVRILLNKSLQIFDHDKPAQGVADANADVPHIEFPDAL